MCPRWDQTVALAKLLDVPVRALVHPDACPEVMAARPTDHRMIRFLATTTFRTRRRRTNRPCLTPTWVSDQHQPPNCGPSSPTPPTSRTSTASPPVNTQDTTKPQRQVVNEHYEPARRHLRRQPRRPGTASPASHTQRSPHPAIDQLPDRSQSRHGPDHGIGGRFVAGTIPLTVFRPFSLVGF